MIITKDDTLFKYNYMLSLWIFKLKVLDYYCSELSLVVFLRVDNIILDNIVIT